MTQATAPRVFVYAAEYLVKAGEFLAAVRWALQSRPDLEGMVKEIDFVTSRLQIIAVDLSLASEKEDPDGVVDQALRRLTDVLNVAQGEGGSSP